MARSSAVPRTLKQLRDEGYFPWVVESFNAFSGQRSDMYGFADIIAITSQHTVAVQVCGADFSSHVRKMTEEREFAVKEWLKGPFREVILIGWRKVLKKRGGKQKVFKPRIMRFNLIDGDIATKEYINGESISDTINDTEWTGTRVSTTT
jgi:hypothetical protein